ncbi:MAG: DUF3025 domain-containing protein, partial [Silvanigrellaceae bacterium]|nr:DUF3025 domain-containing protein [Silvanigrellaceae bacterium]
MSKFTQNDWNEQFLKSCPLFFPLFAFGKPFAGFFYWPKIEDYNLMMPYPLKTWTGILLSFVEQKIKSRNKNVKSNLFENLYELRIFLTGMVNTRPNHWHDFFNMLVWYTFPKTKAALNMRQFIAFDENAEFPWHKPPRFRLREQDLMTIFDEGGCFIVEIIDLSKPLGQQYVVLPFVFGHGVYEQLYLQNTEFSVCGYKICLNLSHNYTSLLSVLEQIDIAASQKLSKREIFSNEKIFYRITVTELINMLQETAHLS